MGQPIAFSEITSPGHERARAFCRELCDWQVEADPDGNQAGLWA